MTHAEKVFWEHVRRRRFDKLRFRRQQIIDGFIVDFYCPKLKLIIEIDGEIHAHQKEYDAMREAVLKRRGLKIIRLKNEDVLSDPEAVLEKVLGFNPSRPVGHPPQIDQIAYEDQRFD